MTVYALPVDELTDMHSHINTEDAAATKDAKCQRCGSGNTHYQGFARKGSYRAFLVCDNCGHAEEF